MRQSFKAPALALNVALWFVSGRRVGSGFLLFHSSVSLFKHKKMLLSDETVLSLKC